MGLGLSFGRRSCLVVAAVAMLLGCERGAGPAGKAERPPVAVETAVVAAEDVDVIVEAVGSFEADQRIEVKARRAGRIDSLPVREGDRVEAGTPLVRLEDRDLTARVDQAKAAVAEAEVRAASSKRAFERSNALRKRGIASEQDHDDVESEYDRAAAALAVARANLAFAEAELAETVVEAPFAGVFGRLRVDPGAFVGEGESLGLLIDDDPLELVFSLPERYVARLRMDLPVTTLVSSHPERPFPGRITLIDPAVDAQNRTVIVEAEVPNADRLLRPGQFGTVQVRLERHSGVPVVPEEALVPTADRLLVFVVEDGSASSRTVETGVRLPGRVEVVSGLRPGETIVVTGHEKLSENGSAAVREVRAPSAAEAPPS